MELSTKKCRSCGEEKPLQEFSLNSKTKDGRRHDCRPCSLAHRRPINVLPEGHKRCSLCNEVKPLTDFYRNRAMSGGYYPRCKTCYKRDKNEKSYENKQAVQERSRRVYQKRSEVAREHSRLKRNERRAENCAYIDTIKASGCIDCGETHPACLEFDHRDPTAKKLDIAAATWWASLENMKAEVAKCDVRCSNCHRKRRWQERQISA